MKTFFLNNKHRQIMIYLGEIELKHYSTRSHRIVCILINNMVTKYLQFNDGKVKKICHTI